jgi:hypothetical protein
MNLVYKVCANMIAIEGMGGNGVLPVVVPYVVANSGRGCKCYLHAVATLAGAIVFAAGMRVLLLAKPASILGNKVLLLTTAGNC